MRFPCKLNMSNSLVGNYFQLTALWHTKMLNKQLHIYTPEIRIMPWNVTVIGSYIYIYIYNSCSSPQNRCIRFKILYKDVIMTLGVLATSIHTYVEYNSVRRDFSSATFWDSCSTDSWSWRLDGIARASRTRGKSKLTHYFHSPFVAKNMILYVFTPLLCVTVVDILTV